MSARKTNIPAILAATAGAFAIGVSVPKQEAVWNDALVVSVYDGDTFTAQLDLGYRVVVVEQFRLMGVDTPELKGGSKEEGERAKDFVVSLLEGRWVKVRTYGQDKYGRWLVDTKVGGKDLASQILRQGLGKVYDGGTRE